MKPSFGLLGPRLRLLWSTVACPLACLLLLGAIVRNMLSCRGLLRCSFALLHFLCLRFALPAKSTASRRRTWRPVWRMRSGIRLATTFKTQLSLLLKVALPCHSRQNGFNHRTLRLPVPLTSDLQMAPKAVLSAVVFYDHLFPGGAEGSWTVRAPGDGSWGRELLRLRLGESAWWSPLNDLLLRPFTNLLPLSVFFCTERNRNPDVSQRNSDDEEQEGEWVPQTIKTPIFECKSTHDTQFVDTANAHDKLNR